MTTPVETTDLLAYIEASPTPWHCVAETEARLKAAGYASVAETDAAWPTEPGATLYVVRGGGSIVAWRQGTAPTADAGFRVIGAHTDSPNLRVKPNPDRHNVGYHSLGVETYGGVLLATWPDRDLGIAGRVTVADDGGIRTELLRVDRPVCRIPNLAIHLNRGVNKDGLVLNKQKHLPAVWALGDTKEPGAFAAWLAGETGEEEGSILGWDLCLYDVQPPAVGGRDDAFIFASRLDNQHNCFCGLSALLDSADDGETAATAVLALFDHEEIGSRSSRGAMSSFLRDVLTRIVGGTSGAMARASAHSFLVSADMSHGVHPNHSDLHDPEHRPMLNGGPVLKTHNEWRYATDVESSAAWRAICRDAGVPLQEFVNRTDLACGSTIGPIVASSLGMRGVDVGCAQWSMHSIRETAGADDPPLMIAAMRRFFGWTG
jgi:aspartyl aminopeptidase